MTTTSSVSEILTNTNNVANNVNVSNNLNNNVIDNVAKSKQADLIADKLILALNNPSGRAYYCKVAYKLPEARIWDNLEQAGKGREPAKLFTWLCQRDMS